jgi:5-methylcytosine-specific restriction endonuclease McrA
MPIRPEMKERYPKDWKLRSRFVREVRAKNRCEWCGVRNGHFRNNRTGEVASNVLQAEAWAGLDGDPVTRIVLTCAHVYDHRPEAASLLNLAALCQRCHNRHDSAMRRSGRLSRRQKECLPGFEGLV